jgi:hypothetical protein
MVPRTLAKLGAYPVRPFGPSRPLFTRSVALPLTPTTLPFLTPISSPHPLLEPVSNEAMDKHQCSLFTCKEHRRSEPMIRVLHRRPCPPGWASRPCTGFEGPRCPRWHRGCGSRGQRNSPCLPFPLDCDGNQQQTTLLIAGRIDYGVHTGLKAPQLWLLITHH